MLKSYAFDFDKNIGFSTTPVLLEKRNANGRETIEVSQDKHYELEGEDLIGPDKEYRLVDNDIEKSGKYFCMKGEFIKQIKHILDIGAHGPSRDKFVEANVSASPTSFITARGQSREELRKGHQMMIYEALQDDQLQELIDSMRNHLGKNAPKRKDSVINTYLDNNYYAPCNNMDFLDSIKTRRQESMYHRKTQAFEGFIKHVIATYNMYYGKKFIEGRTLGVGFSDDLKKNVDAMEIFAKEIAHKYPNIRFAMYNTSDPKNVKKSTIKMD